MNSSTLPGEILWEPDPAKAPQTEIFRFAQWLDQNKGLRFADYSEFWKWSVEEVAAFWSALAEYFEVKFFHPPTEILDSKALPGAHWFPGATLNYAEHALAPSDAGRGEAALIFRKETADGETVGELSRQALAQQVARIAAALRAMGVKRGDRVVGYLPNGPETVIAFLAAASLGAVWSNCPAELGFRGVIERFAQIEPKVLFTIDSYRYGGKLFDRREIVSLIADALPTLKNVIWISAGEALENTPPESIGTVPILSWHSLMEDGPEPELLFEQVPFEHPLWILYSSGTTGIPKAIVQSHGGILLEHLKALGLHLDLQAGDRFFWFTTSGWMMWNFLVSGLLRPGVSVVLFDGSPKHPSFEVLWDFVDRLKITHFGTSAPFLVACIKEGICPAAGRSFDALRSLGSTGAPLPAEAFGWVYREVKKDVHLASISGGTDVCTAMLLGHPLLPVRAGEMQCVGLGAPVESWDDSSEPGYGRVGELVMTKPFPSMPIFFWNDADGSRLRASYFERFPGVWCHGDWVEIGLPGERVVIHGRSDSTLNRGGVRMGTAEFYAVVEKLPEIAESLVIDTGGLGREDRLVLFVRLREGCALDEALRARINAILRAEVSPRHVPDAIHEVPAVPCTLNGKKMEVPVKRILTGMPVEKAVSRESVANPDAILWFVDFAKTSNLNPSHE